MVSADEAKGHVRRTLLPDPSGVPAGLADLVDQQLREVVLQILARGGYTPCDMTA